jgi:LSD1 subclass zinc finger protein
MDINQPTQEIDKDLKCKNCGAGLHFVPGTNSLTCGFCHTSNEIISDEDDTEIVSYDLEDFINQQQDPDNAYVSTVVKCNSCGASTSLPANVTSANCPFCTAALVVNLNAAEDIIKPHYILPFVIDEKVATENFKKWLSSLWFAPSGLGKKVAVNSSQLTGVYLPHWTFDADTQTNYTAKRGDYYYVTETYTEVVDGEEQIMEREVRHTNWIWVDGVVECGFQDIIVSGTTSLSQKSDDALKPWDLSALKHFDERYLTGFRSETYQVKPEDGFNQAKLEMEPEIKRAILSDIGGDEQIIETHENEYNNVGVKYILLPVWISSFIFNNKVYQFVVNANTGMVTGERPKSWVKITLFVLMIIAILAIFILGFAGVKAH